MPAGSGGEAERKLLSLASSS